MEKFTPEQFTDFLDRIEKLKSIPRHCVTSDNIQENVAGHSWRTATMAFLLKDELGEINIDKVIRMCLIHDLGEAVTGDIPTFEKTSQHNEIEKEALDQLLRTLPDPIYAELTALYTEMEEQSTNEAIVYKALDKLEAVIQHNESDISTWLPLEYDLQQTYAAEIVKGYPFLEGLQEIAVKRTREKIASASCAQNTADGPVDSDVTDDTNAAVESKTSFRLQKTEARQKKAEEKTLQKEELRTQKIQLRTEKKAQRSLIWAERRKELNLLTHLAALIMLISFVVLAIDQVGIYGFLGVWLFIALMAASVAILIAGVWRTIKQKRGGILIGAAIIGILLCASWFIYLFFVQGFGLGPIPG